jgi:fructokinase
MTSGPIVGLGEVLWDLLPTGKSFGGAPANFAFHANQLGHPAEVVSRAGVDTLGREIRATLLALGLSDEFVQTDPTHPTGTVAVEVESDGEPRYVFPPDVAWDFLTWTPDLERLAVSCRAVCFGTLAQRGEVSRATIRQFAETAGAVGAIVVADLNLRQIYWSRDSIEASLRLASWLKLNDDELPLVAEVMGVPACPVRLREQFHLDLVCVTRGPKGCQVVTAEESIEEPGIAVKVIDTVGAGDSFTAALLTQRLEGRPLREAVRFANRLAARVAGSAGATPRIERRSLEMP